VLQQTANPFTFDTAKSIAVASVVGAWLLILFGGIIFFSRWDSLDRRVLLYSGQPKKLNKKAKKDLSTRHLADLRRRMDYAFMDGSLISEEDIVNEEHVEYQFRLRWINVAKRIFCVCAPFISKVERTRLSILVGGSYLTSLVRAIVRYHPFTWFFTNRSMEKTRVIRFVTTCKSILLSIFISSIFYQVYYPDSDICARHATLTTCLNEPSLILSGQKECGWDGHSCYILPPPSSAAFLITVSIMTTIILAPFDFLFFLNLHMVCNKRPRFESIGLDSFQILGGVGNDVTAFHVTDVSKEEKAINAILVMLHLYEDRFNAKQYDREERHRMETIMKTLGLCMSHGCITLTTWSLLRFGNHIRSCVGYHVHRSNIAANMIIANMNRYNDDRLKEAYLIQHHIMEQLDKFSRICVRREFVHFCRDLPRPIHPFAWLLGWVFTIAVMLFFIVWILQWGTQTTDRTITNWGINFSLNFIQEVFLVAVIRLFIINVLVIEMVRPALARIRQRLLDQDKANERDVQEDGNTTIYQHVSPSLIAAHHVAVDDLPGAIVLRSLRDKHAITTDVDDEFNGKAPPSVGALNHEQFDIILKRQQSSGVTGL
jgi:hypothetical protein